jgi:hypothetical protein
MKWRTWIFAASCLVAIVLVLDACKGDMKFDKEKWNEQKDPAFPSVYRKRMVGDLAARYPLKGMKYDSLVQLLGIPDSKDSVSLTYKIIEEYGRDIDPVYTQNLEFNFSKDSTITTLTLQEWKK